MKSRIAFALLSKFGPRLMMALPQLRAIPTRKLVVIAITIVATLLLLGLMAAAFVIWLAFALFGAITTPDMLQSLIDLLDILSRWLGSLTGTS